MECNEDSGRDANRYQYERFILTQLLVMALKGVRYLPALLASENDIKKFFMRSKESLNEKNLNQKIYYV